MSTAGWQSASRRPLAPRGAPPLAREWPAQLVDNAAAVNALLPQPQAGNLLGTIEGMAAFQSRRYNSSHGVNASDWLFAKWQALNTSMRRSVRVTQVAHTGFNQKSVSF